MSPSDSPHESSSSGSGNAQRPNSNQHIRPIAGDNETSSTSRSPRPQQVTMPPRPNCTAQYYQPGGPSKPVSPSSHGYARTATTPTSESQGYSPTMHLSGGGPLSPSSTYSNSFVFPIRSVFQGLGQNPNSSQDGHDSASGAALNRTTSRSHDSRTSDIHNDARRYSLSLGSGLDGDNDAGIHSIAQLLQQDHESTSKRPAREFGVGTATLGGKGGLDRSASGRTVHKAGTPSISNTNDLNTPYAGGSTGGSVPSSSRRASAEEEEEERRASVEEPSTTPSTEAHTEDFTPTPGVSRPPLQNVGSSGTVRDGVGGKSQPKNDSAEASGSGLPQEDRPPVGQPQDAPTSVNYRDYPAEQRNAGETTSFTSAGRAETSPKARPESAQPPLEQPQPRSATAGTLDGIVQRTRSSNHSGSKTSIELDDAGVQSLINDFSGIVRLGGTGSLPSTGGGTRNDGGTGTGTGGGSGTGTKNSTRPHKEHTSSSFSTSGGGSVSRATVAKLAQQERQQGSSATRDSVRDFINQQAHTVNMLDPNAPTPSPTPHDLDEELLEGTPEEPKGFGISSAEPTPAERQQWMQDNEDSSAGAPESSERAIASDGIESGTTTSDDEPEPIVTFRFEHVSTEDGHHVVVGREGKLERCEDEPITTPGAVQGFGVLMVLEDDYDTGALSVRQVSENSTELLGLSPRYLFKLDCFTRILTADQEDILRDNLEYLPEAGNGKGSVEEEGPSVFLLSGYGEPGSDDSEDGGSSSASGSAANGRRREWTCWVAAHRPKVEPTGKVDEHGNPVEPPDLIILEFELERDEYNPLIQPFEPPSTEGTDTPESGSTTALSAGDGTTNASYGSGESSLTTVGSAPRPSAHRGSDGSTVMTIGNSSTPNPSQMTSDSYASSKLPPGSKPMGLEGLDYEIPLAKIIESTTNHAKPLRALERMRRSGAHGEGSTDSGSRGSRGGRGSRRSRPRRPPAGTTGTMDVFAVLGQINEQLGTAPDLETFLKITVGVIQDLCRFHRVLIYQFDESMNGQVVSELVEWGKTTDLFKGLMFPAADIPAQARELYKINKVRLLYDRSQTTARIVLRSKEDLDKPLDMTHCYLRAMSPIHIKYLANMHVRSSMSVSIMAFGQLWGLIACHSYGHHGMRVSFPVRQMMRILSDSISRNIERLSYAQRLHTRKLISTIPTQSHPTGYIVSNADDLLQIFDAESGLLVIGDGCKLLGQNDQGQAMLAIAEYLRIVKFDTLKASNHIQRDFPDLVLPRAHDTIAGLLYVPLTVTAGQDFIVFLRKGQVREVQWAGKPYKDEQSGDAASLEPRKSFKTWSETVTGRSRAWTDDQLESAGVLALIYGKFIQVWREKQSAMASNQLTAILLSNTSHAVRTPLSQIINTLELALSGNIDADVRNMLENSHQASRALLFHVHDLLDLTRIETGNETAFNDPFDIRQSIHDAIRLYQTESSRRGLDFRVVMADNLPQYVVGDSRKIKTVISNLVANSVKYTEKGFIEIYCGLPSSTSSDSGHSHDLIREGHVPIEIVISDSGCGIPTEKLEAMFVTLEGAEEGRPSNPGVGLGLAVVARIVEQLDGQLRAESEVGVGSRFFFTLHMLVHHGKPKSSSSNKESDRQLRTRTGSSGSGSVMSLRSGMSEVESFVNDFGGSHMLNQPMVSADDPRLRDAEKRMSRPGTFPVTDSSWPVRPSRVDAESEQSANTDSSPRTGRSPEAPTDVRITSSKTTPPSHKSKASITKPPKKSPSPLQTNQREKRTPDGKSKLRVLVVEDDAINSQILQKRLKMDKHTVKAVGNGQEAVTALEEDWDYDAVLMDIQMPIMDGRQAAKEIRKLEAKLEPRKDINPLRIDSRIPIFAVSASLYESDRGNLAQDFDGWLLKPLDFARVRILFAGLEDPAKRSAEVYQQGHWEKGGYLRDAPAPASTPAL
ncbi:hypothetical protein I316_05209 [Kwoniella heveanensis BCC8398]|uniref:Bacteriophytochrome histidine kinase n=1 Tax=Kwoniella heveanensis BCC8398 TaxID=1296120 RepID=A0A1B9GPZ0_9TREE|nr:hypothetical protein I316_05209 [Kwoniella heveanensis BCC8398]